MEKPFVMRYPLLGALALLLGIIAACVIFDHMPGLGFPLFILSAIAAGVYLLRVFGRTLPRDASMLLGVALFFASTFFFQTSGLLSFLNLLATAALLLIAVRVVTGRKLLSFLPGDIVASLLQPFSFIRPFFETVPKIFATGGAHSARKEIIRGTIMSLAALAVFSALFASADDNFSALVSRFFSLDESFVARTFFALVVASGSVGLFAFFLERKEPISLPLVSFSLGTIETRMLLGSVAALFLLFIGIQSDSLFGGSDFRVAEGLSFAEYAKDGFFEMGFAALLAFLLLNWVESRTGKEGGRHDLAFRVLAGVMILEVIVILFSAWSRLSLYEEAYGWTEARLFGHAFMIWLAAALAITLDHIVRTGKREWFTFAVSFSAVLLLVSMNFMNPDAFIAEKNLERYSKTGVLDAYYLGTLSTDALPLTIKLLDEPEFREEFARAIYFRHGFDRERDESIFAYNLSRAKGYALLAPYNDVIMAYGTTLPDRTSPDEPADTSFP